MSFGIYQSGSAELDFINCQRVNHGYFILNWQHKPEAHPSSYHFIIDHIEDNIFKIHNIDQYIDIGKPIFSCIYLGNI
jgi:hypothetical protein